MAPAASVRVLVTGAAGFAGRHLVRELRRRGHIVHGLVRSRALPDIPCLRGDMADEASLRRALARAMPEAVVHLASPAFVPEAERDPARTRAAVVVGTLNLVRAMRALVPSARLLYISTGMVYGPCGAGRFPREETPARPRSLYAWMKLEAERAALASGLDVVVARPFNHAGPGQDPRFVVPSFAKQIVSGSSVVKVGDLRAERSLADVRDVAHAYAELLEKGRRERIYNICGPVVTMRKVLEGLLSLSGRRPRIVSPIALRRDADRFAGDARRIRNEIGWTPRIPLTTTLRDVLAEWRGHA